MAINIKQCKTSYERIAQNKKHLQNKTNKMKNKLKLK